MRFTPYRKAVLAMTGSSVAFFVACGGGGGGTAGGAAASSGGSSASGGGGGSSATSGSGGSTNTGGSGGFNVGDSGNTGGTGGAITDGGCASSTLTGALVPANILFIVDRSGSMNCNLPKDGQTSADCEAFPQKKFPTMPSKWELTKPALQNAMTALSKPTCPTPADCTSAGVSMFPNEGTNCTPPNAPNVTVKPLDTTWASSVGAFFDTVTPGGKTPLVGASILGYNYMHTGSFNGNRFVVVLTDGFETCAPDQVQTFLDTDVANALKVGIRTFVIGVPGSEDGRAVLSQMAFAGGTARTTSCSHSATPPKVGDPGADVGDCHYDMTDPTVDFGAALATALTQISGTVLTCEIDTPKNPAGGNVDYGKVNVTLDGNLVAQGSAVAADTCAAGKDGWQYNANKSKILLCGQPCTDAKQPNASLSVVLGCPTGALH